MFNLFLLSYLLMKLSIVLNVSIGVMLVTLMFDI